MTLADLTASQDPEVVILVALLECKRLYICRDTYTFLIRFKRINNIRIPRRAHKGEVKLHCHLITSEKHELALLIQKSGWM